MSIYQFLHQYCKQCHSILKRSQLFSFFVKQHAVFEWEWGNVPAAVNFEKGASEGEREKKEKVRKSQKILFDVSLSNANLLNSFTLTLFNLI